MSTDRELLEKAAKAAGYELALPVNAEMRWEDSRNDFVHWNPLTDDGDALRLACKLKINIEHMHTLSGLEFGINCWPHGRGDCGVSEDGEIRDYAAATRRAIVRAAAALGEQHDQ